jgi:PAS domain S-box-containing protein
MLRDDIENLVASVSDAILVLNQRGQVLYANPSAHRLFEREKLVGVNLGLPVVEQGKPANITLVRSSGIGSAELMSSHTNWDGQDAIVANLRDITDQTRAQAQMELQARALEAVHSAVAIMDAQGVIQWVNQAFVELTGHEREQAVGNTFSILHLRGEDQSRLKELWDKVSTGQVWQNVVISHHKDGRWMTVTETVSPIFEEGELSRLILVMDTIDDKEELKERIAYLTYHDPISGMFNKKGFLQELSKLIAIVTSEYHRVAVFVIYFSQDTLPEGYFQQYSNKLTLILESLDVVTATLDAHHLVVGVKFDERSIALSWLVKVILQDTLHDMVDPDSMTILFNCEPNIGVALYPSDAHSSGELLSNGLLALTSAKNKQLPYSFYDEKLLEEVNQELAIKEVLLESLKNNEFEMYFQPQVDIQSDKLIGAEALLRWNNPRFKHLPIYITIDVAEKYELISHISDFVLKSVIQHLLRWREQNLPLVKIALNFSALDLMKEDFDQYVMSALDASGIDPEQIEIEITETVLLKANFKENKAFHGLRERGIDLALDDFGTGYSTLSYLKMLPVNLIKIDKVFIDELTDELDVTRVLVDSIISLSKKLDKKVLAEGVETEAQKQVLRSMGCDYYQGYLFSKPLPVAEFEKLVVKELGDGNNLDG